MFKIRWILIRRSIDIAVLPWRPVRSWRNKWPLETSSPWLDASWIKFKRSRPVRLASLKRSVQKLRHIGFEFAYSSFTWITFLSFRSFAALYSWIITHNSVREKERQEKGQTKLTEPDARKIGAHGSWDSNGFCTHTAYWLGFRWQVGSFWSRESPFWRRDRVCHVVSNPRRWNGWSIDCLYLSESRHPHSTLVDSSWKKEKLEAWHISPEPENRAWVQKISGGGRWMASIGQK